MNMIHELGLWLRKPKDEIDDNGDYNAVLG